MVNPDAVVRATQAHWEGNYSLSTTPKLKDAWRIIVQTFNATIEGTTANNWQVIPAPTGTGKTTIVAQYCARLRADNQPGVLIVSRTKAQANEVALQINEASHNPVAVAAHTDNEVEQSKQTAAPVLVVTHQAFKNAIKEKGKSSHRLTRWERLHQFRGGTRKLIIVDEYLDIFEDLSLQCRDFDLLVTILRRAFANDHAEPINILERTTNLIRERGTVSQPNAYGEEEYLDIERFQRVCFSPLRDAITRADSKKFAREGFGIGNGIAEKKKCLEQIAALEKLIQMRAKVSGNEDNQKLCATEPLLEHQDTRLVILDATAKSNPVYGLLEDVVNVVSLPDNLRVYDGCNFLVSKNHSVGKASMAERHEEIFETLIPQLEARLDKDRKVLLITHKNIVGHARNFNTHWTSFEVANWGALDGKNDWSDYDAIAICGLPYLDEEVIRSRINALKRGASSDDVKAYQLGWLSSCLVQAVNRVRCRRITRPDGGCDPVDIFVMLPNGKDADTLQSSIISNMSGMSPIDWNIDTAKRKAKRSRIKDALITFLRNASPGRYPIDHVREVIDASERGFRNVVAKLTDASSNVSAEFKAIGAAYERGGGRGKPGYLIKQTQMESNAT